MTDVTGEAVEGAVPFELESRMLRMYFRAFMAYSADWPWQDLFRLHQQPALVAGIRQHEHRIEVHVAVTGTVKAPLRTACRKDRSFFRASSTGSRMILQVAWPPVHVLLQHSQVSPAKVKWPVS